MSSAAGNLQENRRVGPRLKRRFEADVAVRMLRKMWRDEWVKLLAFTLLMSAVSVAQVLFWPNIRKIMPLIIEQTPEPMRWLVSGIAKGGFTFYIITQQMMKNLGLFGSVLAVLLGASAVTREKEAGTLELLLAQPISRSRVLAEKFLFNAGVLAVAVIVSTAMVLPAAQIIGAEIDPLALLVAGMYCYLIISVVFALTFVLGIIMDEQMRVVSVGFGIVLAMTLLAIFEETRPASLFGYMDIAALESIITAGRLPYAPMLAFALLSAGLFGLALVLFRKKTV